MRFSPEWAVWCYLVPPLCLFRPLQVMQEIWRVSRNPRTWNNDRHSVLVASWWLLTLATVILALYVGYYALGTPDQAVQATTEVLFLLLKAVQVTWYGVFLTMVTLIVHHQLRPGAGVPASRARGGGGGGRSENLRVARPFRPRPAPAPANGPRPVPGPGEVGVRLRAASINYRDLMIVEGRYNPHLQLPRVPLSDGAGQIAAVGRGRDDLEGRRPGRAPVHAGLDRRKPDAREKCQRARRRRGWRPARADDRPGRRTPWRSPPTSISSRRPTLPCAAVTAWNGLFVAGSLRPGQTVLLQGTGGVSLFGLPIGQGGWRARHPPFQQRIQVGAGPARWARTRPSTTGPSRTGRRR